MFEKKTSLIRCYRRETTMSRRRSDSEVPIAFLNLPESKFEQTEVDVKILDRNDATRKMFS